MWMLLAWLKILTFSIEIYVIDFRKIYWKLNWSGYQIIFESINICIFWMEMRWSRDFQVSIRLCKKHQSVSELRLMITIWNGNQAMMCIFDVVFFWNKRHGTTLLSPACYGHRILKIFYLFFLKWFFFLLGLQCKKRQQNNIGSLVFPSFSQSGNK